VFVGHFLIQFRRAIAGCFGQEIPNRPGASAFFWRTPALRRAPPCRLLIVLPARCAALSAGLRRGCGPRFRFSTIRLRCSCGSQFPTPFPRKVWRLACFEAHEPPLTTPLPGGQTTSPGIAPGRRSGRR
jgi:hypothetical protein